MTIKKKSFSDSEMLIYDDAIMYLRNNIWQFRMWLHENGGRYVRFSLRTSNAAIAESRARLHYHQLMADQLAGKRYFSLTAKDGVGLFLGHKKQEVEAGLIVPGRHSTIKTHLTHWLAFIGSSTKLATLDRFDCEEYFTFRSKTKRKIPVSQSTIVNEQASINAMMAFLFKRKEVSIEAFEFKKLPRIDKGDESQRRSMFTNDELKRVQDGLEKLIASASDIDDQSSVNKAIVALYLLISSITGLRRGEQLQLRWCDVVRNYSNTTQSKDSHNFVKITVRGETSKVRKTRELLIVDEKKYFDRLYKMLLAKSKAAEDFEILQSFQNRLIFSLDGQTPITVRAIEYNFNKVVAAADIENLDSRDLVPYSLRHSFISQMANSGATIISIAEMCGTSTRQIENTYYHTTNEKMIHNALAYHNHVSTGRIS